MCDEDRIYFYLIDKETLMPTLENVMNNYMKCSVMMFGSKVRYGVTFKINDKGFDVHTRKYSHDFMVPFNDDNFEGSLCQEIPRMKILLISSVDKILIYDSVTLQFLSYLSVTLLKSETREPNRVIAI